MPNEQGPATRRHGRAHDAARPLELIPHWTAAPAGSVLVKQGATWVLCTVSVEERVPHWRRGSGLGWLTASYSLLPGSTTERSRRERQGAGGRTREIERLIGRSLRAALDLGRVGERMLHVDCDVLQADGGTRTASVTGGWVALALALRRLRAEKRVPPEALKLQIAGISVGIVDAQPMLDLDYGEDMRADTDLNVVMTGEGQYIEVQGTAEGEPFEHAELGVMLDLAASGARAACAAQSEVLDES